MPKIFKPGILCHSRKFRFRHDKTHAWFIGVTFCIEPRSEVIGKPDIYLLFCFASHMFRIGLLTEYEFKRNLQ